MHDSYYGKLYLGEKGAVNCSIITIENMIAIAGNRSESFEEYLYKVLTRLKNIN